MSKEIMFWDDAETENLQWTTKDEAIESVLDGLDTRLISELEICGYARKEQVGLGFDAKHIVETLLERWDEEYGGEENTDVTEKMIEAGNEFVKKMSKLYEVWQCEIVCREKIDIRKWIKKINLFGEPSQKKEVSDEQ